MTHVYGILGVVGAAISVFYLVSPNSSWREYALVASGWISAFTLAFLLVKAHSEARQDTQQIGQLTQEVASLKQQVGGLQDLIESQAQRFQQELERRASTNDFLASLLTGKQAVPRAQSHTGDDREAS
ncbi:MAG: hypothetical protein EOP38_21580 [Rubrivivax sp.]|nr:MAG: hypothetical protein EOP38_21580 [Rubrivivax sp.]